MVASIARRTFSADGGVRIELSPGGGYVAEFVRAPQTVQDVAMGQVPDHPSSKANHGATRLLWITVLLVPFLIPPPALIHAQSAAPGTSNIASTSDCADLDAARALIRQGKAREAEAAVRRCIDAGNDSESARSLLGLILYQEGRWADSLAEFTHAAKFRTPGASELIVVGLDYVMLKDMGKADQWMTIAAQREPNNDAIWRYLGGIKYSENRFTEAIDAYNRCLSLHPHDVLVEDGIGRSLEGLSRDQDAAAAFRTAMDWQAANAKKQPQPLLHLGALLARGGQSQAALPLLLSAESLAPEDADIHEQLGTVYLQMGKLKDAQSQIETARKLAPGNSHLHWLLATIYRKEGLVDEANRELHEYSSLLGAHSSDKLH